MTDFRKRFLWIMVFLGVLVVLGTAGYMTVEGWDFGDSLYMTVITLTAVGYSEVRPLTDAGRVLTMAFLGLGITWIGLWFALLTASLVELDLTHVLRQRRLMRDLASLKDHVIVCGAGRTGRQVIAELEEMSAPWVAIERDPDRVETLRDGTPGGLFLTADATHDDTLLEAGLERAQGLVACLSEDTDNLFVCLSARDLVSDLTIVARANDEDAVDKLLRAGATQVVSPSVSGAARMASAILRPSVVSFLDIATRSPGLSLRMEQARIEADSTVAGKTLAEAAIPQATGLIVIALRKDGDGPGDFTFNPLAETRLEEGDEIIVLGTPEQISGLHGYIQG
ncbi:MAG: potassium channel protein [Gemmatimonadota bacterium]